MLHPTLAPYPTPLPLIHPRSSNHRSSVNSSESPAKSISRRQPPKSAHRHSPRTKQPALIAPSLTRAQCPFGSRRNIWPAPRGGVECGSSARARPVRQYAPRGHSSPAERAHNSIGPEETARRARRGFRDLDLRVPRRVPRLASEPVERLFNGTMPEASSARSRLLLPHSRVGASFLRGAL